MRGRKSFVTLLCLASLCVCFARASAQTARAARPDADGAESAPSQPDRRDVRVEFEGNRVFSSEQLSKTVDDCYDRMPQAGERFRSDLLDYCVKTDLRWMLLRAGYVRAVVREPRSEMWGLSEKVIVPVEENERYRLGRVKIEGARFFAAAGLRELLPLKRGDIADAVAVTRWLDDRLQKRYADEGFIRYQFEVQPEFNVEAGADEGVVDFAVVIHEGGRFRLRSVKFEGGESAPSDLMRDALSLRAGEVFSAQGFRDAVERLNRLDLFDDDSGRFAEVDRDRDVEFQVDEESAQLDIKIFLTAPGQRRRGRAGAPPEGERTLARPRHIRSR